MLTLQNIAYSYPGSELLFDDISFTLDTHQKIALVGNNGSGKSTLLRIAAAELFPSAGVITCDEERYYVPQHFGQFDELTIAGALRIEAKLLALRDILNGAMTDHNLTVLADDWGIEERCAAALATWGLQGLDLATGMSQLSGGEKTKVFLAGIAIHEPGIVMLDEPSNHLDAAGRALLYDYISSAKQDLLVVSHDRSLLNLLDETCELSPGGIACYGGNYDFYIAQKANEDNAFLQDLKSKEKELRKARIVEREAMERKQKLDARGKKKQEKSGLPTISMNTLRNNAEKSTSRMKGVHAEKIGSLSDDVTRLRKELPEADKMKIGFDNSALHKGKILVKANGISFRYGEQELWQDPLSLEVRSGMRLAIKGRNGSGKTTLIRMLLGSLLPQSGTLDRAEFKSVYIDQDYSIIDSSRSVYEQVQDFNSAKLPEHELKRRLTHFLFTQHYWEKGSGTLSGGEKMRLALCCLSLTAAPPDMIILDEPTNNLDIQNAAILTDAINQYRGTLVVVSHDALFLAEVGVTEEIDLG